MKVAGTSPASAAVTTPRARLPAPIIAKNFRRQEGCHRRRQVGLRQGPRRRDPQGAERRWPHGSAQRVDQRRREGLFRAGVEAQGRRCGSRLLRWLSSGSRPHPEADGRTGPQREDVLGRLDEQRRALDHRWPGCREHVLHLRSRAPEHSGSQGDRRRLQDRPASTPRATPSTPMPPSRCTSRRRKPPSRSTTRRSPSGCAPATRPRPFLATITLDKKGDIDRTRSMSGTTSRTASTPKFLTMQVSRTAHMIRGCPSQDGHLRFMRLGRKSKKTLKPTGEHA